MDYLTYAYLQLGRDAEAAGVLASLSGISGLPADVFKIGYAASAMPVRYAIERRKWSEAAQLEPMAGTQPQVSAITVWARAIGLARSGNLAAARRELDRLQDTHKKLAGDDYWATQVHVQSNEALAWISYAEGKKEDALKLMRAAADEEDAIEKRPITPGAIVPAREQLGDMLLESNRAQEALDEFGKALTMAPQRRGALTGQARARQILAAEKS